MSESSLSIKLNSEFTAPATAVINDLGVLSAFGKDKLSWGFVDVLAPTDKTERRY